MIDYILRPLGHTLVFPLVQFFLLAALALMLARIWQHKKLARGILAGAFFWLFLWSQSVPSQLLLHSLEYRFDVIKVEDKRWQQAELISALACSHYADEALPVVSQWPRCSLQRLLHAARMYQHSPRPVIVSGGMILDSDKPFAQHARKLLVELGVDEKDIVVIPKGETTRQEAAALRDFVGARTLALVTSASHMQRAVNYFKYEGMSVIPVPVDHSGGPDVEYKLTLPSSRCLVSTRKAFREYLGLLYQSWELR